MKPSPTSPKKFNLQKLIMVYLVLSAIALVVANIAEDPDSILYSLINFIGIIIVAIVDASREDHREKQKARRHLGVKVLLVLVIIASSCSTPRHYANKTKKHQRVKMAVLRTGKKPPTWLKLYWETVKSGFIASVVK